MADTLAGEALAALDKLLAERPKRIGHDFSAATEKLTSYREHLLAGWGGVPAAPAERQRLDHLNAVISIVYGCHYPIGSTKWEPLERARTMFAEVAAEPPADMSEADKPENA